MQVLQKIKYKLKLKKKKNVNGFFVNKKLNILGLPTKIEKGILDFRNV